jgi:phytoene/squalene synthetase
MNRIIGVQSKLTNAMEEANAYGDKLAEAMQYTNMLRDVLEDYTIYGRIYLTQDRLTAF